MKSKQNGFTLLEVLIALLVFSFGVLGTLGFNNVIKNSNDLTGTAVNAHSLAQSQLENLMDLPGSAGELQPCGSLNNFCHVDIGLGQSSLSGLTPIAPINLEGFTPSSSSNPGSAPFLGRFLRDWNVTPGSNPGDPQILRVRVRWNDLNPNMASLPPNRSIVLTTNF